MDYALAAAVAMLASAAHTGKADHIPNYDLATMRSMSVAGGYCRKTRRVVQLPRPHLTHSLPRRLRCGEVVVVFGGPTRYGDVTIFFPAPNHAPDRAVAMSGMMTDARTLEIRAAYIGRQAPRPAMGTCIAHSAKGFEPPPTPRHGGRYARPSAEEAAAQMDDAGTPQIPLDIDCRVVEPNTRRPIVDIAFRQHRARRHR